MLRESGALALSKTFKDLESESIQTLKTHVPFFDSRSLNLSIDHKFPKMAPEFNQQSEYAITCAVLLDDKDLIEDLCFNGVRLDLQDSFVSNQNPLELAMSSGRARITEILLKFVKLEVREKIKFEEPINNPSRFFRTLEDRMHDREVNYGAIAPLLHSTKMCDKFYQTINDIDNGKSHHAIREALVNDNVKVLASLLWNDQQHVTIGRINFDSAVEIVRRFGAYRCAKYLLQNEILREIKKGMPEKSFWSPRDDHMDLMDRQFPFFLDDHEKVLSAFNSIHSQLKDVVESLSKRKSTVCNTLFSSENNTTFYIKFLSKFDNTCECLNAMAHCYNQSRGIPDAPRQPSLSLYRNLGSG